MKILVIGATGLVGRNIYRQYVRFKRNEVYGTCKSQKIRNFIPLDISMKDDVRDLMRRLQPEVVFLPAYNANVEQCEKEPVKTAQVNVIGVNNVVEACLEYKAKLVFFSSDYVFDGTKGPYSETDKPGPINTYGVQKLEAEKIIQKKMKDYLIIRTDVVYGWETKGKNFAQTLITKLKNNEQIKVPLDQLGSPTYAPHLARNVIDLVNNEKVGIYNVVGKNCVPRHVFAYAVCIFFELDSRLIIPVKTEDLKQAAKRPLNAGLKIDKIKEEGLQLYGIAEGLAEMRKEERTWTKKRY